MFADIDAIRFEGSRRRRVRARLIGESLEPSCMRRIRTPSVRYQVRSHAAVHEAQEVESWRTRGQREVCNAHRVAMSDAPAMAGQCIESAPKHTRRYRGISLPAPREGGWQGGSSHSDEGFAKKCTS